MDTCPIIQLGRNRNIDNKKKKNTNMINNVTR